MDDGSCWIAAPTGEAMTYADHVILRRQLQGMGTPERESLLEQLRPTFSAALRLHEWAHCVDKEARAHLKGEGVSREAVELLADSVVMLWAASRGNLNFAKAFAVLREEEARAAKSPSLTRNVNRLGALLSELSNGAYEREYVARWERPFRGAPLLDLVHEAKLLRNFWTGR